MDKDVIYAKSNPVETLREHTDNALRVFEKLKMKMPEILSEDDWELLHLAIIYHDAGKIDVKFQNQIRKSLNRKLLQDPLAKFPTYPHGYLSCTFIDRNYIKERFGMDGYEILIKAVFYHHAREELLREEREEFEDYIKLAFGNVEEKLEGQLFSLPQKLSSGFLAMVGFEHEKFNFIANRYYLIKGLLNRIDHAASSGLEEIEENTLTPTEQTLHECVSKMMLQKGFHLREVQQYMLDNRDKNLVVIAATGCGKTEAALLWVGEDKGFYTLPVRVSINAIFERVNELGYTQSGLLHADAYSYYINCNSGDALMAYKSSRQLTRHLTVTTIDQLFRFVYRYNGGEAALSALSYSRLVIDEIQMYSPELVATIIAGLKIITELGGKFAIITATFPYVLFDIMRKNGIELDPDLSKKVFYSPYPKRHRIKLLYMDEFEYEDIIQKAQSKRVLVLCNTVRTAQKTYTQLRDKGADAYLLHSRFLKRDRALLEDKIRKFAPNKKEREADKGIWVSTQIVEASLDIDFDILYTEMCSVDSLLQRMGRVYRNRLYDLGDKPNVFILCNKSGVSSSGNNGVIDREIYEFSMRAVTSFDGEILEESAERNIKQEMVDLVFHPERNKEIESSKYCQTIRNKVHDFLQCEMYSLDKSDVVKLFRNILSVTVVPKPIYDELEKEGVISTWTEKLANKNLKSEDKQCLRDEIEQYTVNIPYNGKLCINESRHLFYNWSGIHLCNIEYDFDGERGLGTFFSSAKKVEEISNFI